MRVGFESSGLPIANTSDLLTTRWKRRKVGRERESMYDSTHQGARYGRSLTWAFIKRQEVAELLCRTSCPAL